MNLLDGFAQTDGVMPTGTRRKNGASMLLDVPDRTDSIPPLPKSRRGRVTRRKKIDGTPLIYRVEEDEPPFAAPSNPKKAFYLQKLRFDDGAGFDQGHVEYKISYYMVAHKGQRRGKWAFAQFAPMMTAEEFQMILQVMRRKGWI